MSERKVLTKYYPPDFDPSKIPRAKSIKKHGTIKVTMMLPMSIRCNTCGEYLGRGTKFNSKKETVEGEDYLGLKIFRFYIRCKKCAAELAIRTDPQNSQYVCESGATKNFEAWKESAEEKAERLKQESEERDDSMKALENRTIDSKREMEILDGLDELRAVSARNADIDHEQLLEYSLRRQEQLEKELEEEDEKHIREMFHKDTTQQPTIVKRLEEEEENNIIKEKAINLLEKKPITETKKPILGSLKVTVKQHQQPVQQPIKNINIPVVTKPPSSLFQYDSDDEEEEDD